MDHVRSVLPAVLRRRGLMEHAQAALIAHRAGRWLKEHAPALGQFLSVKGLRAGTLILHVTNAAAAQECQGLLPALQRYLAEDCRFREVQGIRLERA